MRIILRLAQTKPAQLDQTGYYSNCNCQYLPDFSHNTFLLLCMKYEILLNYEGKYTESVA